MLRRPKPQFKALANYVSAAAAVTSHMADLKHTKSHPETLNTQYESALEKLYMEEFGDAVPEYEDTRCCCCNRKRDKDSWEMLQELFPPYLFYFLVFTGAIPQQRKPCFYMTAIFWSAYVCFIGIWIAASYLTFWSYVRCILDVNCEVSQTTARFDYSSIVGTFLNNASSILYVVFAHTYLRDLLQSRAMQTLICSIGTARIRKSTKCWRVGWGACFCGDNAI